MEQHSSELERSLRDLEQLKSGRYEIRTRHRNRQGEPVFINRLIREDSPYLLQHAHNPVNWFSWSDEAFAEAQRLDRPVFLSIGYSTCHWCHVMEAESFDNEEIARILNSEFVCIKLDREQYPDIDDYYMTGVQIISGQGGWPMSNFLLPDGRPFYAATYFPPAQFADLLEKISQVWQQKRGELEDSARRTADAIRQVLQGRDQVRELDLDSLTAAVHRLLQREDRQFGGLAGAPKFPQEPLLYYFLDSLTRKPDAAASGFVYRALSGMARGGIFDQAGGGFHRYSTDAQWLVPHFEKMLYNQSQLSLLYLWTWRLTGDPLLLRVTEQTLDYVLRDMQHDAGGFYSATDADSEDQEGRYFVWTPAQLRAVLDDDEMQLVNELYQPTEAGNFEGANILAHGEALDRYREPQAFAALAQRLDRINGRLLAARRQRIPPLRDDKIIVAWSAAMATSLAWAGWQLARKDYLEAAQRAVDFVFEHNYQEGQGLYRVYLDGEVSIPAQLEDYANLCEACLTLFDVTGRQDYLRQAAVLMDDLLGIFWNNQSGGFFLGPAHDQGPGLTRSRSAVDGATLSAYGVACQCLASLAERQELVHREGGPQADGATGSAVPSAAPVTDYADRLQRAVAAASAELDEYPPSHVTLLRAIRHYREGSRRPLQFGAQGRVRLAAPGAPDFVARRKKSPQQTPSRCIELSLTVANGFRLVTAAADDASLEPVTVTAAEDELHWTVEDFTLVPGQLPETGRLAGTEGEQWQLTVMLAATGVGEDADDLLAATASLRLRILVCSDTVCLAPEWFSLRL